MQIYSAQLNRRYEGDWCPQMEIARQSGLPVEHALSWPISCHMPEILQGFRQMMPGALRHGVKIHL
ncbi:hypothetical protein [Kaarinaea lacus]